MFEGDESAEQEMRINENQEIGRRRKREMGT
jgi:hypothetical protein